MSRLLFRVLPIRCNTTGVAVKPKKKIGKMGAIVEKKVLPVETDVEKLVKYVCGSNIMKEGKDVELRPVEEYPDWLWTLNTEKPKKLSSMGEADKDSKQYWLKVKKAAMVHHNRLTKIRKW